MNTYKKTIVTLGIALVIIPQLFASVPNIEEISKRQFSDAYSDIFEFPYTPFKVAKNFTAWNNNMAELITIAKNNGGNDAILTEVINKLLAANGYFTGSMKAAYALFAEKPNPTALEKAKIMIFFANNTQKIDEAITKLRKETYFLPGKRKAKDILLFIFDYVSRANTAAEKALSK